MKDRTLFDDALPRRSILTGAAALGVLATTGLPKDAFATPKEAKKMLAELTGVKKPKKGRVTIEVPSLTDQGALVPIRITVDSPMSADDYVKEIHVVGERNSKPEIATFRFTPMSGKAEVSTRVRMKETQIVLAAAVMNDGSVFLGKARCRVVGGAGGCG